MITSSQVRAARGALRWTSTELAKAAGINVRTILRIETGEGVPSSTTATIEKIRKALEKAGVEFIGTPDDAPGIRIHRK